MLSVTNEPIMLSVVMLNVVIMNVVMLNVAMLNNVMLNVVKLSVTVPYHKTFCYSYCCQIIKSKSVPFTPTLVKYLWAKLEPTRVTHLIRLPLMVGSQPCPQL